MQSSVERWATVFILTSVASACGGDDPPTGNGNNNGNNTVTLTARHGHAMVYDGARRQMLLFGGTGTEGTSPSGDRGSMALGWQHVGANRNCGPESAQ